MPRTCCPLTYRIVSWVYLEGEREAPPGPLHGFPEIHFWFYNKGVQARLTLATCPDPDSLRFFSAEVPGSVCEFQNYH